MGVPSCARVPLPDTQFALRSCPLFMLTKDININLKDINLCRSQLQHKLVSRTSTLATVRASPSGNGVLVRSGQPLPGSVSCIARRDGPIELVGAAETELQIGESGLVSRSPVPALASCG
jgi:hypothetical protein